jgi:solute:Na+ symporter, SSS family
MSAFFPLLGAAEHASRTPLVVICIYLGLLFALGVGSTFLFKGSSSDFFTASHSIGPFMLLMSLFGTTMTAFALVGSTAEAYEMGIGVYGLMASSSGLIHAACFFMIGIKMWAFGKKYGYVTQIQFFKARFESPMLGYLLFPILVGLIIPYLLVGIIGAGSYIGGVTKGMFPGTFEGGSIPPWLTGLVICFVVLFYVFFGGVRSTAWANTFQTIIFMVMGMVGFWLIARGLGGAEAATQATLEKAPEKLSRAGLISKSQFLSYLLIPLSVGMFPHLFQHWLTAKNAKAFRLTLVAHPIFIAIVWVPCILIGIWAAGQQLPPNLPPNAVLGFMIKKYVTSEIVAGLFSAGVLAAIMSSLDSQFVCISSMFTYDFALPIFGEDKFSEKQKLWMGRGFIVFIVAITYVIALFKPTSVFSLGIWCFSGFSALFPIVFAAIYWKKANKTGAIASVIVTIVSWLIFFWDDVLNKGTRVFGATDEHTHEYLIMGVMPVAFMVLFSAIAMLVGSLLSTPPSDATVEKFFPEKN